MATWTPPVSLLGKPTFAATLPPICGQPLKPALLALAARPSPFNPPGLPNPPVLPASPGLTIPESGRTFLLFAPWCDQGLGVHAKNYVAWLHQLGHRVVVFACKPSKCSSAAMPTMQADPDEWQCAAATVHTSSHTRETVPYQSVVDVAIAEKVTDAFLLETARSNIFVIAAALHQAGVRVYAVPNIEMVRRQELKFFIELNFAKVLCHNRNTYDNLKYFKVPENRLRFFPFALQDIHVPRAPAYQPHTPVQFLLVGGMNAIKRKQADKVLKAFTAAFSATSKAAHLTILCQGHDIVKLRAPLSNVTVVHTHLSYGDVMNYYGQSHVVVMCSRAEGIGLATHEALRSGCPVLTLDTAMYKELITPTVNGWLLPAAVEAKTMAVEIGNDDPIVHTYTFDGEHLQTLFKSIVDHADLLPRLQQQARQSFEILFDPDVIMAAWTEALLV